MKCSLVRSVTEVMLLLKKVTVDILNYTYQQDDKNYLITNSSRIKYLPNIFFQTLISTTAYGYRRLC